MPPVEGALVLTRRGRVLASCVPAGTDTKSLAQECRAIMEAGSQALAAGGTELLRVDLRADSGSAVVMRAGKDAILAVLTSTKTPESLSLELTRAAASLSHAIG